MSDVIQGTGRKVPGQSVTDQQKLQLLRGQTRVFDRERKLAPERVDVHIPVVKSIASFNPQPVSPIAIEKLLNKKRASMTGVINQLTSDQAKMGEKVKSDIALTTVRKGVIGRVALHSPGFGEPQIAKELPQTRPLTLVDKFFIWINSLGRRVKK